MCPKRQYEWDDQDDRTLTAASQLPPHLHFTVGVTCALAAAAAPAATCHVICNLNSACKGDTHGIVHRAAAWAWGTCTGRACCSWAAHGCKFSLLTLTTHHSTHRSIMIVQEQATRAAITRTWGRSCPVLQRLLRHLEPSAGPQAAHPAALLQCAPPCISMHRVRPIQDLLHLFANTPALEMPVQSA